MAGEIRKLCATDRAIALLPPDPPDPATLFISLRVQPRLSRANSKFVFLHLSRPYNRWERKYALSTSLHYNTSLICAAYDVQGVFYLCELVLHNPLRQRFLTKIRSCGTTSLRSRVFGRRLKDAC